MEQPGHGLEQQQDLGRDKTKQVSTNLRAEIVLACFCLNSFWEQFLEDTECNLLPHGLSRAECDRHEVAAMGPIDLIGRFVISPMPHTNPESKSFEANTLLWLLRAEEFRLLSEPCEIALWYSGGEPGHLQSGFDASSVTALQSLTPHAVPTSTSASKPSASFGRWQTPNRNSMTATDCTPWTCPWWLTA